MYVFAPLDPLQPTQHEPLQNACNMGRFIGLDLACFSGIPGLRLQGACPAFFAYSINRITSHICGYQVIIS